MPGKGATARRHRDIGSGNGQVAVGGIPTKLHMRARVIMHHAPARGIYPTRGHAHKCSRLQSVTCGYLSGYAHGLWRRVHTQV